MWNRFSARGAISSWLALASITMGTVSLATAPTYAGVGECPISADFGGEAEIVQEHTQMAGLPVDVTLKRAFVQGGMVAIECNNLRIDDAFPGTTDEQFLLDYLTFYGMSPIDNGRGGIDHFSEPVPHVAATGFKELTGTIVVYSYRLFRFPNGSAMAIIAFPAGEKERGGLIRFLESLSLE